MENYSKTASYKCNKLQFLSCDKKNKNEGKHPKPHLSLHLFHTKKNFSAKKYRDGAISFPNVNVFYSNLCIFWLSSSVTM